MSQLSFTGDVEESSRYLKRFRGLVEVTRHKDLDGMNCVDEHQPYLRLVGDTILVERLGKIENKTKHGIIMPTTTTNGTYKNLAADEVIEFGVVLMTGPGDIDPETGNHYALTTRVGDIISLPMNVQWYSQFGHMSDYEMGTIGRMRDAQVMMVFPNYEKAMEVLNGKKGEV